MDLLETSPLAAATNGTANLLGNTGDMLVDLDGGAPAPAASAGSGLFGSLSLRSPSTSASPALAVAAPPLLGPAGGQLPPQASTLPASNASLFSNMQLGGSSAAAPPVAVHMAPPIMPNASPAHGGPMQFSLPMGGPAAGMPPQYAGVMGHTMGWQPQTFLGHPGAMGHTMGWQPQTFLGPAFGGGGLGPGGSAFGFIGGGIAGVTAPAMGEVGYAPPSMIAGNAMMGSAAPEQPSRMVPSAAANDTPFSFLADQMKGARG